MTVVVSSTMGGSLSLVRLDNTERIRRICRRLTAFIKRYAVVALPKETYTQKVLCEVGGKQWCIQFMRYLGLNV
jgi:hypothetical protein